MLLTDLIWLSATKSSYIKSHLSATVYYHKFEVHKRSIIIINTVQTSKSIAHRFVHIKKVIDYYVVIYQIF